jgi:NADH-quinone oxidoreductase subunit A
METVAPVLPVLLFAVCVAAFAVLLLVLGNLFGPRRSTPVKQMPYESGMDPIHDTRRRFDVRFHLLAIAFLVFDVELLFLYPWAVSAWPARVAATATAAAETPAVGAAERATANVLLESPAGKGFVENRHLVFAGVMVFIVLLALGFVYDWRKGVFEWR